MIQVEAVPQWVLFHPFIDTRFQSMNCEETALPQMFKKYPSNIPETRFNIRQS